MAAKRKKAEPISAPPKAKKAKTGAATKPEPEGYAKWQTRSELSSGLALGEQVSQWDVVANGFIQTIKIHSPAMFKVKPLTLTDGPYKGHKLLMLEPVDITDYFTFTKLPAELRLVIYELLLLEPEGTIKLSTVKPRGLDRRSCWESIQMAHPGMQWNKATGKWIGQSSTNMSILRVSKQLLAEAAPIFYGKHTFSAGTMSTLAHFLRTAGDMRQYIKHISLGASAYTATWARKLRSLLQPAHNLESFTVPHSLICTEKLKGWYLRHCLPPSYLAALCAPMLKASATAHNGDVDPLDVQGILRLTVPSKCYHCRTGHKGGNGCGELICNIECKDRDEHHQDLVKKLRSAVARCLGLTVVEEGSQGERSDRVTDVAECANDAQGNEEETSV
ncbi:hypothetical protein BAUCODRAFT_482606 [Baudoinia panamericana UAMH 10762]|uniref:DUF7730 domain-containing protein n=1 Tax=Baudoinia panamericana (strain UAMH 10762) TaxID=717646 RepID=M2NBT1_BAUPA|nr:uncharacterized protein BAUCODRAFT_482606 [Baudoinia panamericana UAMH 10762]EMC96609.1 hypothetical protein BAUCODRAFT_482606 [Baudoinia panamericana UAMH 10762]